MHTHNILFGYKNYIVLGVVMAVICIANSQVKYKPDPALLDIRGVLTDSIRQEMGLA